MGISGLARKRLTVAMATKAVTVLTAAFNSATATEATLVALIAAEAMLVRASSELALWS
jgi:hypothetical protein